MRTKAETTGDPFHHQVRRAWYQWAIDGAVHVERRPGHDDDGETVLAGQVGEEPQAVHDVVLANGTLVPADGIALCTEGDPRIGLVDRWYMHVSSEMAMGRTSGAIPVARTTSSAISRASPNAPNRTAARKRHRRRPACGLVDPVISVRIIGSHDWHARQDSNLGPSA